jgi:hypothetical protein
LGHGDPFTEPRLPIGKDPFLGVGTFVAFANNLPSLPPDIYPEGEGLLTILTIVRVPSRMVGLCHVAMGMGRLGSWYT